MCANRNALFYILLKESHSRFKRTYFFILRSPNIFLIILSHYSKIIDLLDFPFSQISPFSYCSFRFYRCMAYVKRIVGSSLKKETSGRHLKF